MTALDQAFIKAFTRQNTSPLPHLPLEAGRGERNVPKPKAEDPRRTQTEKQPVHASSFSSSAPIATASPIALQPSPDATSQTRSMPLSATLDGVWAALGRPPRAAIGFPKLEPALKDAEEAGVSSYCSIVESPICSFSEPLDSCFMATTIEPAFAGTQESSVVTNSRELTAPGAPEHTSRELLAPGYSADIGLLSVNIGNQKTGNPFPEAAPSPSVLPSATATLLRTPREFKPGWQVDHFTWPKVCRRLIARAAEELDRLADALLAANAQGHKVLAIGGCRRGEGATTLLLCAARRLAERGIKPILVDADLSRPRLAKRLCLQPQFGWDETSDAAGQSLDQAIVEATANNVALLPAREPPAESGRTVGDPSRLPGCLETLRNHYDMVLVDLGPLEEAGLDDQARTQEIAQMIDAVVLVHNSRITSENRLTTLAEQLAAAGITTAGIVENFVPED